MIAYFFHGHYYTFEGIELRPKQKINGKDLAYTKSKPIVDLQEKVDENNHLAAAVDGLLLLAGIVGLTVLSKSDDFITGPVTQNNYKDIFDFEGSEGDFEIINRGNRPYGWYLFVAGRMTPEMAEIRHARILNLLKELFMKEGIIQRAKILCGKLEAKGELNFSDFNEVFGDDFVQSTVKELIEFINRGLGKPMLVN